MVTCYTEMGNNTEVARLKDISTVAPQFTPMNNYDRAESLHCFGRPNHAMETGYDWLQVF